MYLVYEGMDKTGKDTLIRKVAEATGFKYVHINRGPIGYMVYDEIYNRSSEESIERFENDWNKLKNDAMVIYLTTDLNIIEKRIREHNDPVLDKALLVRTKQIYEKKIAYYCQDISWITIDTTSNSIKTCVFDIVKFINEVQRNEKCNLYSGK